MKQFRFRLLIMLMMALLWQPAASKAFVISAEKSTSATVVQSYHQVIDQGGPQPILLVVGSKIQDFGKLPTILKAIQVHFAERLPANSSAIYTAAQTGEFAVSGTPKWLLHCVLRL